VASTGGAADQADATSSIHYVALTAPATQSQIDAWVTADQAKRGADAAQYRYAYIPAAFLTDPQEANYARIGLSKALNSVAIAASDIVSPEDVSEGHGVVYALPLAKYWGDQWQRKWQIVSQAIQARVFSPAPTLDLRAFDGNKPVSADRLAYNLLHGGVYNQLIDTPSDGQELKQRLGVGKATDHLAVRHPITYSPRYIQRHELPGGQGSYWETFDEFYGQDGAEIPWLRGNPIPQFRFDGMLADYQTVASEAWNNMKNGLPAYYIWGNADQERSKAEQSFVRDPLNLKGHDLLNGFCVFCHIAGPQQAPNDMATAIDQGTVTNAQAKAFWTSNDDLGKAYARDRQIYVTAMRKIVLGISDGDAKFNDGLISSSDNTEPCYFLISDLTGNPNHGDTAGKRHRP